MCARWISFNLALKGKGQRSIFSDSKAERFYLDARRWAGGRARNPLNA